MTSRRRAGKMAITVAMAGDTMLGRGVAEQLRSSPLPSTLFCPEILAAVAEADLFVLNLECCVSDRGERWQHPGKPFFFRAPSSTAGLLAECGVDCVTLANNHALDYGFDALADTRTLLDQAGVRAVGAGKDLRAAREFAVLEAGGVRVAVVGATDHPDDFAADEDRAGVAYADLGRGVPGWLTDLVAQAAATVDVVLVTPHWGPNMTLRPPHYVLRTAPQLLEAGATLVAGHSAHVFHGVGDRIIYDMGDFVDDYAVDAVLRNDHGLLFLVTLDGPDPAHTVPVRLEAIPLFLDYCHTRLARGKEWNWIRERFTAACAELGTAVTEWGGRLRIEWQ
ncbi:CapA family protein [Streptomyces spiramyceticus]|uniref:CapA family protein n=1 Tax=Streptomyces spiramyceticus TaxID=299717 RepID=UPI00237A4C1A|nr:CapA family protein [Streptomyces spiramyceticus]